MADEPIKTKLLCRSNGKPYGRVRVCQRCSNSLPLGAVVERRGYVFCSDKCLQEYTGNARPN